MSRFIILIYILAFSSITFATPFETCPSYAFLFQSNPSKVHGINLLTGQHEVLQHDTGVRSQINAVGFNSQDGYIYGYYWNAKKFIRLGKDLKAKTLNTTGVFSYRRIWAADVYKHTYYYYLIDYGLFKIDLSPLDSNPNANLPTVKITSHAPVNLSDIAFNPVDDQLYGIFRSSLYHINKDTGSIKLLGDVGIKGFGGIYFGPHGNLYLSKNDTGHIYRIDLSDVGNISSDDVTAVKVANGPASSNNDGARCATAPLTPNLDFGDAPDSYQTRQASNGPSHKVNSGYYLGPIEGDADKASLTIPLNDNIIGALDEDGIGFVTALEVSQPAIVLVQASKVGHLSAWVDWNQDGTFDDPSESIANTALNPGTNAIFVPVPTNAEVGTTWSRFRFAENSGLKPGGNAPTGEIEDYPVTITQYNTKLRHYPSEAGFASIAYEDNWPQKGDYDFNDVVFRFHITETLDQNEMITNILIRGHLAAYGTANHNGFAFRLPGLNRDDINPATTLMVNAKVQSNNGLEPNINDAIFIVSNDIKESISQKCNTYRTDQNCQERITFNFEIDISINNGVNSTSLMSMPYDPFIFASPGDYVREGLETNPGRGLEIHLTDKAPTEKFDTNLYGLWADASNPVLNRYFKTSANHPWALLISGKWKWPREGISIVEAYPEFAKYAKSGGKTNTRWFYLEKAITGTYYLPKE